LLLLGIRGLLLGERRLEFGDCALLFCNFGLLFRDVPVLFYPRHVSRKLQSSSARNREPPPQDFCGLTSADSGFQLDLVIALSGVPAKLQPHGLIQPCRKMR